MSLSSYLAEKYLTASNTPNPSKKRKRKQAQSSTNGLIIADDDAPGWTSTKTPENDDDDSPTISNTSSSEFRRSKKSGWKTVGVPALQPKDQDQDESAAEADRIIREAAAENSAALHADEEPTIDEGIVKMSDGTHAGLQSAAAVTAQMETRRREELATWERESGGKGKMGKGWEETVYRDATGRRIDISMRRSEAKREMDEKARKEAEEKERQKGEIQLREKAQRREELDEARFMPLARGVDDVELNEELKGRERWDDPALRFLVKGEDGKGKSKTGKPLYKGAAPPNRYGIRPGHRWDGVDRGNGWEAERFKAENRKRRNKELDFQWQMDE